MLRKPKDQIHVFDMVVFHDEDGENISLHLIDYYKDYADILSEEKIHIRNKTTPRPRPMVAPIALTISYRTYGILWQAYFVSCPLLP